MTDAPDLALAEESADRADLLQLSAGSDEALGRIIQRWSGRLQGFAQRHLQDEASSREAVSQAFVRLHEHRGSLRPDSRLSAWLFTTTANLCKNQLRWRRRHPADPIDSLPLQPAESRTPASELEASEKLRLLQSSIGRLDHDDRTALLLSHYEGQSHRQIAEILGGTEKSIESRLYRVRRHLAQAIAREAGK